MLSGASRLKKKKDFESVFKKGRGFKEGFLFLKLAPNGLGTTRFGFVVGQKVSKKATVRNRVKRRLRGSTAAVLSRTAKGFDVVVVAEKETERADSLKIKETLERLFKKSKILHD